MSDIGELIRLVQIENIRAVEANLRTSIRPSDDPEELEAGVRRRARVVQLPDDGVFIIRVDFAFTAHRMSEKEREDKKSKTSDGATIAVAVSFEVNYRIPSNASASEETLNEFAEINGIFNAWPYFREFVHAALARMGLPPFILPVYRLGSPKKSEARGKRETKERTKSPAKTH
jgi:hypothetical protein